ncbi:hypothetical protein PIB30_044632 [Stylosanthes scabra]|uniref:Sporozoite surface protein 2-like n=1 Tax=Stylosanthes scabra TaxID=79078 RepID=A0ABU6VEX5_9FABA|nr:hypothetical protein [Stylosanthes scabra]
MACFSYVVLFAFFLLSSHLFARQLPNEKRFSISNKPQWTIPLTETKIAKDHSTTPLVGYYSRDSNLDSNPILPMLFFSKKKKPKKPPKTSPKSPPRKPPVDQKPKTYNEQVPLPHPPPHPYYPPNPYNDYNDPPNYYERPKPFGSNLPPIGSIIEPLLPKRNQEDLESEDTDLESKKTDPKSKESDRESKKTDPESKKSDPKSKKDDDDDDDEKGQDSMDNTAHLISYYHPLGFENFGKRFQAYNMEEVDELKGSKRKLKWAIPFTQTKIEKDHFSTPSVGKNYYPRDSHPSRTLILPMLFSSEKKQPKEPQTNPHGSHGPNIDPHNGQHDPHIPQGPHSGQYGPHGPHGSHNGPYDPHTGPHDPYNNDPYNGRYGSHSGPRNRYDYDNDPYDDDQYGSRYRHRPRWIDPNDLPPGIWETIKDTAKEIWEWFYPKPAKSSKSPPSDEEKKEDALDSTHFDVSQHSSFHDIDNHEDGDVVWHHKMNSPSDISWRTTHSSPTKISPWTQGGSMSYYGDNVQKEKLN